MIRCRSRAQEEVKKDLLVHCLCLFMAGLEELQYISLDGEEGEKLADALADGDAPDDRGGQIASHGV